MRRTKRYPVEGSNSLWQLYKTVSFFKVARNFVVLQTARYTPFFSVKNWLYRNLLGMKVGEKTAFALMVMPDTLYPEMIKVGRNTIIGYNSTILAHEYLVEEYRLGEVIIGDNVMIGANSTVLPGVVIGDGAVISAATLVHRDVPAGAFAGGNPMQIIKMPEQKKEQQD
ncbi:acyltransferase [Jeotgalibacillus terrae]|uniref:Acyltransferase n=1 Tax=Jeotgalibacillus terrae TaxID=587735 RepID=A0ABW5ZEH2_9BACL|nr:DapH/DapD/GlmU-related protein [Jeotgalibacillus terrae]MBM7580084.1 acetyltransferase-like isoleucine patch superfamily enzyme [Jeotgalibacillus terrae]